MRSPSRFPALATVVVLVTAMAQGCAKKDAGTADSAATATVDSAAKAAPPKSLFDRLGGQPAITAVIDSFVAIVAKDDRINKKFAKSDVARVKKNLVDQVCAQTGGPCTYTGLTMKEAHEKMGVTEGEFNALVEDLVKTLTAYNVAKAEQDELLNALGSMKGDIVEVPGPATGTPLPKAFVPAAARAAKK
jgi:hemoglobin